MVKNELQSLDAFKNQADIVGLLLAACDETGLLLCTLRACKTAADLITAAAKPAAVANVRGIGELLALHAAALGQGIHTVSTSHRAIARQIPQHMPGSSRARTVVCNAEELIDDFTDSLLALESMALLVPLLDGIHGDGLGEAVHVVVRALQEQADAMASAFEDLRSQLQEPPREPARMQQEGAQ